MEHSPKRTYYFSDTYGGHTTWNPLKQPDPDALISTDFGSRPTERIHREFDIFGQEEVVHHLLRLILKYHDELADRMDLSKTDRERARDAGTGILMNSAPRTDDDNGTPFYLATAREDRIKIVATPLSALSSIRDDIETIDVLDNPPEFSDAHNGLYNGREQFRSRLIGRLLDSDHGLRLHPASRIAIPEHLPFWHVSYVDRFGNIVTYADDIEKQWDSLREHSSIGTDTIRRVGIDLHSNEPSQDHLPVELTKSLSEASPGALSIYRNGNDIDIVSKWDDAQNTRERIRASAWNQLGRPCIGTILSEGQVNNLYLAALELKFAAQIKTSFGVTVHLGAAKIEDPFGLGRLSAALQRLKPGKGIRPGRPTDPNWTHRPKVPMSQKTIDQLTVLATQISTAERKVSPMQVAAWLTEEGLLEFFDPKPATDDRVPEEEE